MSDPIAQALLELLRPEIERIVSERVAATGGSVWLDAAGAAEYLAVPVKRVRNLTAADEIPHVHEGRRVFYHRGQLDSWRFAQSSGPRFPPRR